jgi:two-component system, LuxR family, sensor kinase FixL
MYSPETQALMQAAVDAIIVIDHHGQITSMNDATRRMFGYDESELLGSGVHKLMPEPDRGAHDVYMREHLASGVARIIGVGREVQARRKNGQVFPAHLSVGRITGAPPSFIGIVRDVTAQHDVTRALQLERDRANAYLELNDSILLMLDPARRIREINARGSEILGAPGEDLQGRDWLDFTRGDGERAQAQTLLDNSLATPFSREREFDALDANGQPRRIYWRCIARRAPDGTPAGWLCCGHDVTDRQRREEDAALVQERLTRVAHFASMGEMAAGVAHELNQPLTAITTYARACDRHLDHAQPDFGEVREAVREIGAEGLRAGEIIRRLRQLVRGDASERRVSHLNTLVEELRVLIAADARVHGARLRIELQPDLPAVCVDPVQIQQVILNLVRNALEAVIDSPAEARAIDLTTARAADGDVEIRVLDNGRGVAPAVLARLFEPFCTTKESGTGLGLAISRTIVHSHKGSIGTRPVTPHGAEFFVRLPAIQGSEN